MSQNAFTVTPPPPPVPSFSFHPHTNTHTYTPELKELLRCATGSPYHKGNELCVKFHSQRDFAAFSFGTCGNQMTVSTLIPDEDSFNMGLMAVLPGRNFTMP